MPRINRIRIINFSYNNDSRHIQDETFNFHGGENALLSLANPRASNQRFFSQEAVASLCLDRVEVGWSRGLFADGYRDGVCRGFGG